MARGGAGDEGEEAHPLRWLLDAARYAAASTVTVLILIVVVKASKVVLFPDSLYVAVVHGSVLATGAEHQPPYVPPPLHKLFFQLSFRIDNPSRRVRMHYVNVTAYLFDNDTPPSSSDPEYDCMVYFPQSDIVVGPQMRVEAVLWLNALREEFDPEAFDLLYDNEGASMRGVTMRMDAMLLTESGGGHITSRRHVTYYCWPLVILHHDAEAELEDDVFCGEVISFDFIIQFISL